VNWAAKMAVGLNTGVPWVMCKQTDAPDPVVSSSIALPTPPNSFSPPLKPKITPEKSKKLNEKIRPF
jgi:hypothetical protein